MIHTGDMARVFSWIRQLFAAIGREIAATIRFGAIPAGAAPVGRPAQSNAAAVVAGIGVVRDRAEEPNEDQPYPG
jgi:hypothetical protein